MSNKLYVGNLPYSVTQDDLEGLFKEAGKVISARIITDAIGRSKGFGFVEMASNEEAQEAINRFNGHSLKERNIVVNEARPQQRKERGDRGYKGRGRY